MVVKKVTHSVEGKSKLYTLLTTTSAKLEIKLQIQQFVLITTLKCGIEDS